MIRHTQKDEDLITAKEGLSKLLCYRVHITQKRLAHVIVHNGWTVGHWNDVLRTDATRVAKACIRNHNVLWRNENMMLTSSTYTADKEDRQCKSHGLNQL